MKKQLPWVSAFLLLALVGGVKAADGPRALCGQLSVASTTVTWTPNACDSVELYTGLGDQWQVFRSKAVSAALSVSNSTRYDIFLYRSGNQIALQKGLAWASGVARGTGPGSAELTRQDGALVNAQDIANVCAAKLCRFVGTISVDGGGAIAIAEARLLNSAADGVFTGTRSVSFPDANSTAVVPGSATAQQFVTHIDANGVQQKATAGDVSAPSNFGTDNVLIMSHGTNKEVEATGIVVGAGNSLAVPGGITAGAATNTCDGSAGCIAMPQGTAPSAIGANEIQDIAPTSVTSYRRTRAGASCAGFLRWAQSTVGGVPVATESCAELSGDATTSGSGAVTIANAVVNSPKMAAVNTRRVCMIVVGDGTNTIADADFSPFKQGRCYIPYAATLVEVTLQGDAGTPGVVLQRRRDASTVADLLSGSLAGAGTTETCAMSTTSQTCFNGTTSSGSITLSNTSISAGDWIEIKSGTGSTAKQLAVAVVFTVN